LYPLDALELTELELDKAFYFFEAEIQKASAIGEVGLDFKYSTKKEEKEKQEQIFRKFITLSKKYSKPMIIHSRFAQKRVLEILREEKAEKVLLHSFCDSLKLMKEARSLGYYISCGMIILSNKEMQKNISSFSAEKLLFETDSPMRFNGEKAYPDKIPLIAKRVSELTSTPLKEIELNQKKAFSELFR
jgi:TatD DNase family protein